MTRYFSVKTDSGIRRVLIAGLMLVLFAGSYFAAKWGFANTIATRTNIPEVAELGVELAPADPLARYAYAGLLENTFEQGDVARSLVEYETAVSLSPSDYRFWLGLGRARERDGDRGGAEAAYRQAAKVAPHYSRVHWALGNLLVRQGSLDDGFGEIRAAASSDQTFAGPAAAAAWQAFDGDLDKILAAVGDSNAVKVELARLLTVQKRFTEAVIVWRSVPLDQRRSEFAESGKQLSLKCLEGDEFRLAASIISETSPDADIAPKIGVVANGGFEQEIKTRDTGPFEWRIADGSYPQIGLTDGQKRAGSVSLFVRFTGAANAEFRDVSQLIAVDPSRKYRIWFSYRSELKSQANVRWEAIAGRSGMRLGISEPILPSSEWRDQVFDLNVPSDVDGITLRLIRENCKLQMCVMTGAVWFDEFRLEASN